MAMFFIVPMLNDFRANKLVHKLMEYPWPPDSKVVEMHAYAGNFAGTGDGIEYFGALLVKSDLDIDEMTKHYAAYTDIIVKKQDGQQIKAVSGKNYNFRTNVSNGNYYIVYTFGYNKNPIFNFFDFRGI